MGMYLKKKRFLFIFGGIFIVCLLFLSFSTLSAKTRWFSVSNSGNIGNNSTHHKITQDAIKLLDKYGYKDVADKFAEDLMDWTSGSDDDANAHDGNGAANGCKNITNHWKAAYNRYKKL